MSHVKNASYDIILAEVSLSTVGKGMRIPLPDSKVVYFSMEALYGGFVPNTWV